MKQMNFINETIKKIDKKIGKKIDSVEEFVSL